MTETMFAERTRAMGVSAIREILKVASQPGMISLAGGLPAAEAFPTSILQHLTERVFEKYGSLALQYDCTEGFTPLRQALAFHLSEKKGICISQDDVLVATGSQGVLDALGKILISRGDRIAVEAPTYLGAIQAFNPYGPDYVSLETDEEGLIPESLEDALHQGPIKIVYLVPTFQNPTGRTLSVKRRAHLAEIIRRHDILVVEDDPYSDLRYEGGSIPSLQLFAPDQVIYIGTLSKIFAPGLRIGYCVAPEKVRQWMVLAKQGVDLHTGTLSQALAAEYLVGGYLEDHLPRILECYRPRRKAMLDALDIGLPDSFKWSRPEGGMFVWLEGPPDLDMDRVYEEAVKRGVAVVPGKYFFADPERGGNTLRLNFSMPDVLSIKHAVAILAELLREHVGSSKRTVQNGDNRNPYPRLVNNVISQFGTDFNRGTAQISMSQAVAVRKF